MSTNHNNNDNNNNCYNAKIAAVITVRIHSKISTVIRMRMITVTIKISKIVITIIGG